MSMSSNPRNRRTFLRSGARGLALAAGAPWLVGGTGRAAEPGRNPFAYDVERYRKTDPALIAYDRVEHFPSPHPAPRRLAIGPEDRLYLASGPVVAALNEEHRVAFEIRCTGTVYGLAVSADGLVYAALRDHVEVSDAKGKRLAAWATPEGRPFLTGVAVSERDVFVADAGNRVVWRHDLNGEVVGTIGRRDPDRNIPGHNSATCVIGGGRGLGNGVF